MRQAIGQLRQNWARSRAFRVILIVALTYAALRLAVHGAYLAMMLYPEANIMGGMPDWTGTDGRPMVPVDLQVYLDASEHLLERKNLYLQGPITRLEDLYQYSPAYALAFVPWLLLSPVSVSVLHTLLHLAAYVGLYLAWYRIFYDLGMRRASQTLTLTIPVWLAFSAFWSDLGYLNIYILMALLGTLLIRSIVRRELVWSVLWVSVILQTKPQWAFAAILPLLLGQHRFFAKLTGCAFVAYGAIVVLTMIAAGPNYVGTQYLHYFRFLWTLPSRFPWRGLEAEYLGYNHSLKQVAIYLLGESSWALQLVAVGKVLLLAPLGFVSGRYLTERLRGIEVDRSAQAIDLAFALYLGAFIWLDMVWELSLGIAIFGYLLATLKRRRAKYLVWAVFAPYALVDLWQLISFAVFGMDVIAPGPYILTDPSIYVPLVMIVILVFYGTLLKRLWGAASLRREVGVW